MNMQVQLAEIGDNQPPEPIQMLLPADDLKTVVSAEIAELTKEGLELLAVFDRVPAVITEEEEYERVTTLAGLLKTFHDKIEDQRSAHKAPYLAAGRVIDEEFSLKVSDEQRPKAPKGLKSVTAGSITSLKERLSAFDTKKLAAQRLKEAEARDELAKLAAQDGIELHPETPAATGYLTNSKSRHGGSAIRQIKREWTITNEALIPASLMSPDPVKIQALIDGGAASIPGIEIEEKVATHVKRQ